MIARSTPSWVVHHGDCLDVMRAMPDASVDAVITDPPYGISVAGSALTGSNGTRNLDFGAWDNGESWGVGLTESLRLLKRPGSVFAFCGHRQFGPIVAMLEGHGMTTRPFAWVKACPVPAAPGMRWTSGFELAVYAFDEGSYFRSEDAGQRPNVLTVDSYRFGQPGKVDHPTQKPLALMRQIVSRMVPQGGAVLDPYAGSGSTGVAALEEGCRFIGIEREAEYVAIARARIEAAARAPMLDFGGAA